METSNTQGAVGNRTGAILAKPQHIISLSSAGVLVNVDISSWSATQQDRGVSDEVTTAKKADRDSGKFVKNLLAKNPEHRACLNYRQTVYNFLQRRTYDWAGSQRILPSADLPKFMEEYREHEKNFNNLVDAFIDKYPSIVSDMAFVQGDLFDADDYPSTEWVRSKFSMDLTISEVPIGDFRTQIAADLADDLATHYERQAKKLVQNILDKQTGQLVEIMQSLSYCCETETVIEDGEVRIKRRKLYDTTLNRARELCDTFAEFNLTQDTRLEEARVALSRALGDLTIDQLRNSDTKREVLKESVDDILSKFGV
jgi:hypothetical protein